MTAAKRQPRLTIQALKVLGAFQNRTSVMSGSDINQRTKIASGTLYPILFRLEEAGWLSSHWEIGDASVLGRPRKRLYQITGLGSREVLAALNELRLHGKYGIR